MFRISTQTLHDSAKRTNLEGELRLFQLQQQLSTGRRVVRPEDDPIAASAAMRVADTVAKNEQFVRNQTAARNTLSLTEGVVGSVGDALQDIRERLVQAGGALNAADRRSIAADLRSSYQHLLGLANTRDAAGNYLFAGHKETTQPFVDAPGGATYQGDEGRREIAVSASRSIAVTESGREVFERVRTGNGFFKTSAVPANAGSGIIDQGSVFDPASVNGDSYRISFSVTGGVTTFSVVDTTTATTLSSGNAFTSGAVIRFAGMAMTIEGAPADGDGFDVQPAGHQSLFTTLDQVIRALERPSVTTTEQARLAGDLGSAIANVDQAQEKALGVRAGMGASLRELDVLGDSSGAMLTALQTELSSLVDLDYAKAISDFTRQQQALEAARAAFARIVQQNLFDYLR